MVGLVSAIGWTVWGLNPSRERDFSLRQNVQTNSESTQHCIQWGLEFFPGDTCLGCAVNYSPASSVRLMSGAVSLLCQYI